MLRPCVRRVLSLMTSLLMALTLCAPATAWAMDVEVTNHARPDGRTVIADVSIDGVAAPEPGLPLDMTASVTAEPAAAWEVPVLWLRDDLELASACDAGRAYLPAIAFYVPGGYALEGDSFAVTLSDSLTALFGGAEVVSVYDASTGISYILPASLRGFFATKATGVATAVEADDGDAPDAWSDTEPARVAPCPAGGAWRAAGEQAGPDQGQEGPDQGQAVPEGEGVPDQGEDQPGEPTQPLVDIYCSKTAKDAIATEDLERIVDLVVNRLEPQAAVLLSESFPAFADATENELGKQIGLYVYYEKGDKDGVYTHENVPKNALAFVWPAAEGEEYCYMIGLNVESLLVLDEAEKPVKDGTTGKLHLIREGEEMDTLGNTMVHELFHAFMDDYNRTGMEGAKDMSYFTSDEEDESASALQKKVHDLLVFPNWFIEGSASTVENAYQCRTDMYDGLRTADNGKKEERYTQRLIVKNYVSGQVKGKPVNYDLKYSQPNDSGSASDNEASAYVMGYLATLYLADLASIKTTGKSAITYEDGNVTGVDTERLRDGLSYILNRTHEGDTLDRVIEDISQVGKGGDSLYEDTDDFTSKFIKGPEVGRDAQGKAKYADDGDVRSSGFVADYLNYLLKVSGEAGRKNTANGSILFPAERDYASPLDLTAEPSCDYYKIAETSRPVPSTVENDIAFAGGGKSDPGLAADAHAAAAAPESDGGASPSSPAEAQDPGGPAAAGDQLRSGDSPATDGADRSGDAPDPQGVREADDPAGGGDLDGGGVPSEMAA